MDDALQRRKRERNLKSLSSMAYNASPATAHPSYALADVPIVRSAHLWTPDPVQLPVDIHPLPDDIQAYVSSYM
jgi:hypothetical protein